MAWFAVACYFKRTIIGNPHCRALFEVSISLYECGDADAAAAHARSIANDSPLQFANVYGETVVWEFTGELEVFEVSGEIGEGTEVFARFLGKQAYDQLRRARPTRAKGRVEER